MKQLQSFKIFNKWGALVYQTSEPGAGWDGYYQSQMQFLETYTWYVEGLDELDKPVRKSGNTILVK